MNDRELLELAAKAAGYDETRTCIDAIFWVLTDADDWHPWNPLTSDGDALRLAVKRDIEIYQGANCDRLAVFAGYFTGKRFQYSIEYYDDHNGDKEAATRRAIVCAAAASQAAEERKS